MNNTYVVYIALCSDGTYYVGCTGNLENRIIRHHKGEIQYTKSRLPITIVTYITFNDKYQAYNFEKYLKTGSGRAFMYKRLVKRNTQPWSREIHFTRCTLDFIMVNKQTQPIRGLDAGKEIKEPVCSAYHRFYVEIPRGYSGP
jgi:predicted GIY-YIG superfamily endonuclease